MATRPFNLINYATCIGAFSRFVHQASTGSTWYLGRDIYGLANLKPCKLSGQLPSSFGNAASEHQKLTAHQLKWLHILVTKHQSRRMTTMQKSRNQNRCTAALAIAFLFAFANQTWAQASNTGKHATKPFDHLSKIARAYGADTEAIGGLTFDFRATENQFGRMLTGSFACVF